MPCHLPAPTRQQKIACLLIESVATCNNIDDGARLPKIFTGSKDAYSEGQRLGTIQQFGDSIGVGADLMRLYRRAGGRLETADEVERARAIYLFVQSWPHFEAFLDRVSEPACYGLTAKNILPDVIDDIFGAVRRGRQITLPAVRSLLAGSISATAIQSVHSISLQRQMFVTAGAPWLFLHDLAILMNVDLAWLEKRLTKRCAPADYVVVDDAFVAALGRAHPRSPFCPSRFGNSILVGKRAVKQLTTAAGYTEADRFTRDLLRAFHSAARAESRRLRDMPAASKVFSRPALLLTKPPNQR